MQPRALIIIPGGEVSHKTPRCESELRALAISCPNGDQWYVHSSQSKEAATAATAWIPLPVGYCGINNLRYRRLDDSGCGSVATVREKWWEIRAYQGRAAVPGT